VKTWDNHPAKFSTEILALMKPWIPQGARVLDPFAGTGLVHELGTNTVGVEIEPEGAAMHPRTVCGDALALPFPDEFFDFVVTSPCYGNRMADKHDAQEKCQACEGRGYHVTETRPPDIEYHVPCNKCGGEGRRKYKRYTYTHTLGRKLHDNNTGGMQWGRKYRAFHIEAWVEVVRVLKPGGRFIINTSNHIRNGAEVDVTGWHHEALGHLGMEQIRIAEVATKRNGNGANRELRCEYETVAVFEKAA
jgi:tRNA G10  N-methylase Trm11